jgi:uncharacterized repeat protein (TIGR03803 family)
MKMKLGRLSATTMLGVIMLALGAMPAHAQTLKTLVNFDVTPHGWGPLSTLIMDANGNLFGTTANGGPEEFGGTVFKLAKTSAGYASTPSILVNLKGATGESPFAGMVADADGNLFGTAFSGGNDNGTVFEVVKTATGYLSTPRILFTFDGPHGALPGAGLIIDAAGNLFGTTLVGGASDNGTVFEIAKTAHGYASTPTVLVSFDGTNGMNPYAKLLEDAAGDLFGTTYSGGGLGGGTAYEIVKTKKGYSDTPVTLFDFDITHGSFPQSSLIADARGDLFGTTSRGGALNFGTVYEIVKTAGGYASTPDVLVSLDEEHGIFPLGDLIADAHGNLFGTSSAGGTGVEHGTVFEVVKTADGYSSTPIVLANFDGANGSEPAAALLADSEGNLFGTTFRGGTIDVGTVFEITDSGFVPPPHFAGMPGTPDCKGASISSLAQTYGDIGAAAKALRYANGEDLQQAVDGWCGIR